MGMVVSHGDARLILESDEWKAFVAHDGIGHLPFSKYVALRDGPVIGSNEVTAFLADQSLRHLIADFVRRDHHERGKTTLELHPFLRQLVDDGDSIAFETIADLGVAHGLQDSDLDDDSRFPEERDVFDGKVNVRFLARLLRIGDLLDMSSRRADPMTARAVGPLPIDAEPHWQQYSAKKHENITPKRIEFTFECSDQDAHRVLRDWFGWLESEVRASGLEQLHSARHDNWKAPLCIVSSQVSLNIYVARNKPTIIIKPEPNATYTFHDWKLELDHDLVLHRLIHDVYDHPAVFVRELIQNALDATRCQMYVDFASQYPGATLPKKPTQLALDFRDRYPVLITFSRENVSLSPDGPTEERSVITIEDHGTGMDEEIIRRYFLQVGRSYYQSNEFRERYEFVPTSRFGVGFLSVFAVSKDITVDTCRRNVDTGNVKGIRLRLREPRNYLLTEAIKPFDDGGMGDTIGTRIRVVLDNGQIDQPITTLIKQWCVAVEVPIVVRECGTDTTIRPLRLEDRKIVATGRVDPEARFVVRTFDIDSSGVEGQLAVIAYEDENGEGWCDCWPQEKDLGGKRVESIPELTRGFTALHGVTLGIGPFDFERSHSGFQWVHFCDIRSNSTNVSRARSVPPHLLDPASRFMRRRNPKSTKATSLAENAVNSTAQGAVEHHLANSERAKGSHGIYYVGRVLSGAPVSDEWRSRFPGTVVTWQSGKRIDITVEELLLLDEVIIPGWGPLRFQVNPSSSFDGHPRECLSTAPIVSWSDTPKFSDKRFVEWIDQKRLVDVKIFKDLWLLHFASSAESRGVYRAHKDSRAWIVPIDLKKFATIRCEFLGSAGSYFHLLNERHPVIQWLVRLRETARRIPGSVNPEHVDSAWHTASTAWYNVDEMVERWAKSPAIPKDLRPPALSRRELWRFSGCGTF